jgi:hypothetical protein
MKSDIISEYKTPITCKHGRHVIHIDDRSGAKGVLADSWVELRCSQCYDAAPDSKRVTIDGVEYDVIPEDD